MKMKQQTIYSLPTRFQRFSVNGTDAETVSDVGLLLVLVDCVDI
jgi:hypothetical protein